MNVSPANPGWFNRDRFVLSAGHGSALLYSMLHLSGFDLSIEDLKGFRQWGDKTPDTRNLDILPVLMQQQVRLAENCHGGRNGYC